MNFKEDRAFKLLIFKKMLLFVTLSVCEVSRNLKRDISFSTKTRNDKNSKRVSSIASLPQNDKLLATKTQYDNIKVNLQILSYKACAKYLVILLVILGMRQKNFKHHFVILKS
ncbi:hypothetical protein DMC01_05950 [Campylobacter troglodytis]|nr:hypothetical protein DMC01_05950 [Campylobacter troglodytis]